MTTQDASNVSGKQPTPISEPSALYTFLVGNRFKPGIGRQFIIYVLLLFFAFIFLLPFYWMLNTSLKVPNQVFTLPPAWFPDPIKWDNYVQAWGSEGSRLNQLYPVYWYVYNTSIITINGVVASVFSSAVVAYAFARMEFPGKNFMFLGVISTLMVPFTVVMVPQFIIWRNLDWLDTYLPLMVPHWFGSAWNIFLLRQFFMTIPTAYDEAALIDGASRWGIFWRIILPLSTPALAAVGIFAFVFFWNDFLGPLIILSKPVNFTLTLYLANFSVAYAGPTPWNLYMAAALIIVSPCMVLFFLSQRVFLQGITITDFKR
ncbi:MAG: carbohydrate ABC transporter permease [Chloroflexota bacterium]